MNYFLLLVSVTFFCLNASMTRWFQTKISVKPSSIRLFQAGFCAVAAVFSPIIFGFQVPEMSTVMRGLAFGLLFAAATHMAAKCFDIGSMALTYVIINMSMAVPLVYSFIFYNETIAPHRMIGLLLMLCTFVISGFAEKPKQTNDRSEKTANAKKSKLWLTCVLIGFIANGATAVLQKSNQRTAGKSSGGTFLFIGYLVSAIYFIVLFVIENKGLRFSMKTDVSSATKFTAAVILSGAGSSVGNSILGSLSTKIDAAVLYPCLNGALAIMTALVSTVIFREKVSCIKALSISVGLGAIVLLAI